VDEIPVDIVDDIILTDDASRDNTSKLARKLGLHVIVHDKNRDMAASKRPAMRPPSPAETISLSCSIRTTSTRRCWSRPWLP
jgi:hypothetical protein